MSLSLRMPLEASFTSISTARARTPITRRAAFSAWYFSW